MRPVVDAFSLAVVSELTPVIVAEAPESTEDDSAVSAGARFVIVIVTVTVATCVFPITDEVLFIVDIPSELKLDKPADDTDGEGEETGSIGDAPCLVLYPFTRFGYACSLLRSVMSGSPFPVHRSLSVYITQISS